MFFSKPAALIYLQKNNIQLYLNPKDIQTCELPKDVVSNMEVINQETYQQSVIDFFTKYPLANQKVVIVLSPEIYFEKSFVTSDVEKTAKEINYFIDSVPFDDQNKVNKEIKVKGDELYVISTNQSLYLPIIKVLENQGSKAVAVVPITMFLTPRSAVALQPEEVKQLLGQQNIYNILNFLIKDKPVLDKVNPEQPTKDTSNNNVRYYMLSILILIVGLSFILITKINFKFPFITSKPLSTENSPTQIPTPVNNTIQEASSSSLTKELIRFQVLNGSGIAGQATKIKNLLTNAGFSNILTGNSTNSAIQKSTVNFSKSIPSNIQLEVFKLLQTELTKIASQSSEASSEADILIITGKL